jgi:hypothetical protein
VTVTDAGEGPIECARRTSTSQRFAGPQERTLMPVIERSPEVVQIDRSGAPAEPTRIGIVATSVHSTGS